MLLGIYQRIVACSQFLEQFGSTFHPGWGSFVLETLWEYRIVLRGGMELAEAVLCVGADVIEEIVRVLTGGIRTNQRFAAIIG